MCLRAKLFTRIASARSEVTCGEAGGGDDGGSGYRGWGIMEPRKCESICDSDSRWGFYPSKERVGNEFLRVVQVQLFV